MSADLLETDLAARALAMRLGDWGVDNPGPKARAFMDELVQRGWKSGHKKAPRNPRPDEECPRHPGQYAHACGGCNSDRRAKQDEDELTFRAKSREDALAAMRESLHSANVCNHGTLHAHCKDCRPSTRGVTP